jgi:hypothetical protein
MVFDEMVQGIDTARRHGITIGMGTDFARHAELDERLDSI